MAVMNFQESEDARIFAESIVETVREPLLILDEDLIVISANRAFYRQFQVESSETEGKQIYKLVNQWDIKGFARRQFLVSTETRPCTFAGRTG